MNSEAVVITSGQSRAAAAARASAGSAWLLTRSASAALRAISFTAAADRAAAPRHAKTKKKGDNKGALSSLLSALIHGGGSNRAGSGAANEQ